MAHCPPALLWEAFAGHIAGFMCAGRVNRNGGINQTRNRPQGRRKRVSAPHTAANYPFTLTRENDNIARPVVGLPMESAGRKVVKVVKISMFFFNCGSNGSSSLESDRMR